MDATSPGPRASDAYNATLIEREDLTPRHAIVRVRFDDGPVPDFEPGQHTQLGLLVTPEEDEVAARKGRPRVARRTYSIASPPATRDAFEFYLYHVPDGRFSSRLWTLRPGEPLFVERRVSGSMTLRDVPNDRDLVCVATGTGIAPFMSMVRAYRGTGRWRKLVILHGTRLTADLGYRRELEQAAHEDPTIVYLPTVTREPADTDWVGLRGRVHQVLRPDTLARLAGVALTPESCHVFLCGNPAMVDDCEADLLRHGFTVRDRRHPEGNIHFERYW